MTTEKVVEALRACRAAVVGKRPWVQPKRLNDTQLASKISALDEADVSAHLVFMCEEAERMLAEGPQRREKVMRWLGFVQGASFALGITTISESKDANRPEESKKPTTSALGDDGRILYYRPRYGSGGHLPHGHGDDGHGGDDMHRGAETNRSGSSFVDGYEEGTFDK